MSIVTVKNNTRTSKLKFRYANLFYGLFGMPMPAKV